MKDHASDDDYVSKSELKRQALQLQALGAELAGLKRAQLEALPLPDRLAQAIFDYQRFPSHEARRRQMQYIGRLMRDVDPEPLLSALAGLRGESADARFRQHEAERWRDRLLADADALHAFLDAYPLADRQAVRQAVLRARKPAGETQSKTAARALFRVLRDQIPDPADDATGSTDHD